MRRQQGLEDSVQWLARQLGALLECQVRLDAAVRTLAERVERLQEQGSQERAPGRDPMPLG
jgi:hypothetical protein